MNIGDVRARLTAVLEELEYARESLDHNQSRTFDLEDELAASRLAEEDDERCVIGLLEEEDGLRRQLRESGVSVKDGL